MNKLTDHKEHNVEVKRANITSPHYGYYFCITCNKFMSWVTKEVYYNEKNKQFHNDVMWFGKYQGTKISDLSTEYLQWAIDTIKTKPYDMKKLSNELDRRNLNNLVKKTVDN